MEENFYLQNCCNDDALSFNNAMFKAVKVREAMKQAFRGTASNTLHDSLKSQGVEINPGFSANHRAIATWKWFDEGVDCEILRLSAKGWQKGKMRIRVSI